MMTHARRGSVGFAATVMVWAAASSALGSCSDDPAPNVRAPAANDPAPPSPEPRVEGRPEVASTGFDTIDVTFMGRYWGGWYSKTTPAAPPVYDPPTRRVFTGSVDRHAIEIIDIRDPARPTLFKSVPVPEGGEPTSFAYAGGLIVATVDVEVADFARDPKGRLLVLGPAGDLVAEPIILSGASRCRATSDGTSVVVVDSGSTNEDYTIDREASVAIVELGDKATLERCRAGGAACNLSPRVRVVKLDGWNAQKDQLLAAGVRVDPFRVGLTVAQDLNPEALAVSEDGRTAWISFQRNNAIGKLDLARGAVVAILPAGSKTHDTEGNGFDPSDKDDGIHIRPWPVRSLYQPDGMEAVTLEGSTYLVTANEGDPHDQPKHGRGEKYRLGDFPKLGLSLDPVKFPNAEALMQPAALGRLQVTILDGDRDGDKQYEEIVMLGSRSFTIRDTEGRVVWDSGDGFERVLEKALPAHFNASEDKNAPDERSDDRGAETEHVTTGVIDGRTFAFLPFERTGGFAVYEITNPRSPRFMKYVNSRNFAVEPAVVCGPRGQAAPPSCAQIGDSEPEEVLFIPRKDSPVDTDLLVLIHEASDTTAIFRIDRVGTKAGAP